MRERERGRERISNSTRYQKIISDWDDEDFILDLVVRGLIKDAALRLRPELEESASEMIIKEQNFLEVCIFFFTRKSCYILLSCDVFVI